jgi:hypothetical protein
VTQKNYQVYLRDKQTGHVWSMFFYADNYGHAEEQALDTMQANVANGASDTEEIVKITKDWDQ